MKHFDAIIIGGGILGCMTARNLRRWNISTLLVEKEGDSCTGITRAKNCVTILGSGDTVREMIRNESENRRFTALDERIKELCGEGPKGR